MKFTFIKFDQSRFLKQLENCALFEIEQAGTTFEAYLAPDEIARHIEAGSQDIEEFRKALHAYDLHGVEAA